MTCFSVAYEVRREISPIRLKATKISNVPETRQNTGYNHERVRLRRDLDLCRLDDSGETTVQCPWCGGYA